jgi:hypothetical protein
MVITVAMAANTSSSSKATVGGGLNAIATENHIYTNVADGASITGAGDVSIGASSDMSLLLVSLSVSAAASGTAIGGTVGVIVHQGEAVVTIGSDADTAAGTDIESTGGSVAISSKNKEQLIHVIASASGSANGAGFAGVLSVLITNSKANIILGDKVSIVAADDVLITAESDSFIVAVSLGVAGPAAKRPSAQPSA